MSQLELLHAARLKVSRTTDAYFKPGVRVFAGEREGSEFQVIVRAKNRSQALRKIDAMIAKETAN